MGKPEGEYVEWPLYSIAAGPRQGISRISGASAPRFPPQTGRSSWGSQTVGDAVGQTLPRPAQLISVEHITARTRGNRFFPRTFVESSPLKGTNHTYRAAFPWMIHRPRPIAVRKEFDPSIPHPTNPPEEEERVERLGGVFTASLGQRIGVLLSAKAESRGQLSWNF